MSNPEVLRFYDDIHSFTTKIILNLKLPKIAAKQNAGGHMEAQSCLSTAMVFFHKYFLLKKVFSHEYTKYLTCCTCIFLSLKVSNLIVPLDKLIDNFLVLYFRDKYKKLSINEKLISEISNKMFQIEFEILNTIGFDLNVDLPYNYIYSMKAYFQQNFQAEFYNRFILIITSFINDSFKIPVCLFYEPLLIFLSCVHLVQVYFNIQLKDKEELKWYQLIDKSVKFDEIVEISNKIKMVYDYSNNNISNNSYSASLDFIKKEEKKFIIDFNPSLDGLNKDCEIECIKVNNCKDNLLNKNKLNNREYCNELNLNEENKENFNELKEDNKINTVMNCCSDTNDAYYSNNNTANISFKQSNKQNLKFFSNEINTSNIDISNKNPQTNNNNNFLFEEIHTTKLSSNAPNNNNIKNHQNTNFKKNSNIENPNKNNVNNYNGLSNEYIFKIKNNYNSDFSRIKSEDHLII